MDGTCKEVKDNNEERSYSERNDPEVTKKKMVEHEIKE
jgi:hypothetical protein